MDTSSSERWYQPPPFWWITCLTAWLSFPMSLFTTDNTSTQPLFSNTFAREGGVNNSVMDTFLYIYFANMIIHKKSFVLYIPPTFWPCGILANWQLNPHPDSAEKEKEMQEKVKRRKVLGNMIQGQELHPTFAFSFYFCNSYLKSSWIVKVKATILTQTPPERY